MYVWPFCHTAVIQMSQSSDKDVTRVCDLWDMLDSRDRVKLCRNIYITPTPSAAADRTDIKQIWRLLKDTLTCFCCDYLSASLWNNHVWYIIHETALTPAVCMISTGFIYTLMRNNTKNVRVLVKAWKQACLLTETSHSLLDQWSNIFC